MMVATSHSLDWPFVLAGKKNILSIEGVPKNHFAVRIHFSGPKNIFLSCFHECSTEKPVFYWILVPMHTATS